MEFDPLLCQPVKLLFVLGDAGDLAENATAYVSIEPCTIKGEHCTVLAVLKDAGIDVTTDVRSLKRVDMVENCLRFDSEKEFFRTRRKRKEEEKDRSQREIPTW
ncbi:hypothetical protein YC2023_008476 [Brassica napus]